MNNSISENLRTAREAKGLSQAQIAEMVGIKQQSYHSFERGLKTPSVSVLIALADVLEESTDKLLGRECGKA